MQKKRKQRKRGKINQPVSPDLRFGPGGISGFTPAGLTGFHDLKPAKVIRELLQNSLDAGREVERETTIVRFETKKHGLDLIPGIKSYRSAFEQAKKDQEKNSRGKLPDTATGIVRAMEECLGSSECETLFVLDNGIGLDKERMKGLLADGLSVKNDSGTGAVGNGHFTVLPASDLRYVLYGGRTQNGEIIGSGHAVLASHQRDNELKSKDGYYVKNTRRDHAKPYVFPENGEISAYIKDKLEWIAQNWEVGTVVAVPGFNRFREDRGNSLWDMVSKAAACNFFAAFAKGELCLEFRENSDSKKLDKTNIASILSQFSEEKRTRSGFLAGSRALAAFETIKKGEAIRVDTGLGHINMRWRSLPQGGPSRVDLCRNGMWITDDLPKLQRNRFTGRKPFHCVILLDASDGEIHRLVRKAEGPLHNNLENRKYFDNKEKNALIKAMDDVFSKINEVVPTHDSQEFKIEDFLTINSNGILSGGRRPGLAGQFQEIRRVPSSLPIQPEEGEEAEGGPGPGDAPQKKRKGGGINPNRGGRGTFRRAGNAIQFDALAIPVGKRAYRVELVPGEKIAGSEVRFAIDESLDESCDPYGRETFARLKNVKLDSGLVEETMLTHDEADHALGVKLGSLEPAKAICIEFDYELPTDIGIPDDMPVVLKTQLIRRAPASKNQQVP